MQLEKSSVVISLLLFAVLASAQVQQPQLPHLRHQHLKQKRDNLRGLHKLSLRDVGLSLDDEDASFDDLPLMVGVANNKGMLHRAASNFPSFSVLSFRHRVNLGLVLV